MPSAVIATRWVLCQDANSGVYSSTIYLDPSIVPPDTNYRFETSIFKDVNSFQSGRLYSDFITVVNNSDP